MRKSIIILCFILALSFLVRSVFEDPWYSGLDPYMYYTNAERIVDGRVEQLSLWVWFIGYPLLISFFFLVFGVNIHSAIFVASVLGTLTVLAVYLLGRELVNEEAGLFSALILALSPAHAHLSMTIMSDVPGLFFVVLAVFLYTKFLRSGKSVFLYLTSFVFGWAVLVKYSNGILILLPILHKLATEGLSAVSLAKLNLGKYFLSAVILAIALSPQLAYNHMHYGNPFAFTVLTTDSESETGLSIRNAFTTGYLRTTPPLIYYPYLISFKFNMLPPFLTVFYILGVFALLKTGKKSELALLFLWFTLPFILLVLYSSHEVTSRLSLPLLPPLAILGSAGLCYTVKSVFGAGYRRVLLFFGVFYLVMVVPVYWLITDNVRVHGVEEDFQRWIGENTEKDSFVLASKHHIDAHIVPIMGRDAVDLRVALAGSLDNIDPGIDYDLKKLNDSRSPREKLASILSEHPRLYVVVSQYGNDEVENFGLLEESARLRLVREENLRLSRMSPWRSYSIFIYNVEGLK